MMLDTTFLIDLERELETDRVGRARRFLGERRNQPVAVSVISLGELAASMPDNETAREFVSIFHLLHMKPEIGLAGAEVDRFLIRTGGRLGENDTWLAGTARYYGIPIISNDRAFDRVPGLRRIAY
jgi:predicted nucleic acid-binding protein